jgi:hypothetical protein
VLGEHGGTTGPIEIEQITRVESRYGRVVSEQLTGANRDSLSAHLMAEGDQHLDE